MEQILSSKRTAVREWEKEWKVNRLDSVVCGAALDESRQSAAAQWQGDLTRQRSSQHSRMRCYSALYLLKSALLMWTIHILCNKYIVESLLMCPYADTSVFVKVRNHFLGKKKKIHSQWICHLWTEGGLYDFVRIPMKRHMCWLHLLSESIVLSSSCVSSSFRDQVKGRWSLFGFH